MENKDIRTRLDKLIAEAKEIGVVKDNIKNTESHPGIKNTDKVKSLAKKSNDESYKDTEKVMKDYDKVSTSNVDGEFEVPQKKLTPEEEDFHYNNELSGGMEDLKFDGEITDKFKDRQINAIEGDSTMGNAPTEATEATPGVSDPDLGKNLVKRTKDARKQEVDTTITRQQFGDDIELVPDKKPIAKNKKVAVESKDLDNAKKEAQRISKEEGVTQHVDKDGNISDFYDADNTIASYEDGRNLNENKKTMKRLRFKKPFNGMDNAIGLIPEGYKEDKKTFELTDGVETYRVRWEGDLTEGKAIVLTAKNEKLIKEDMGKIAHLMNFKSEDTLGLVKGHNRIDENAMFNDILNKTKNIIKEDDKSDDKDKING